MPHELLCTSAERGLQPGSSGFCTVVATRGIPPALQERLEHLSSYRHLFAPLDPRNPVGHSHLRLTLAGRLYHVLSRIAPFGLDYSRRGNRLAHHVVLEPRELPPGGPAWLLSQPGFMLSDWDGNVHVLPVGRTPPAGDCPIHKCRAWEQALGDAGWAGVLAESAANGSARVAYLLFEPGQDVLPFLTEALALLSPAQRWQVTFSTYYGKLPADTACRWRCVPVGSPEAKEAERMSDALILDLSGPRSEAPAGSLMERARSGNPQGWSETPERGEPAVRGPFSRPPVYEPIESPSASTPRRIPSETKPRRVAPRFGLVSFLAGVLAGCVAVGLAVAFLLLGAVKDNSALSAELKKVESDLLAKNAELTTNNDRVNQLIKELESERHGNKELADRYEAEKGSRAFVERALREERTRVGNLTEQRLFGLSQAQMLFFAALQAMPRVISPTKSVDTSEGHALAHSVRNDLQWWAGSRLWYAGGWYTGGWLVGSVNYAWHYQRPRTLSEYADFVLLTPEQCAVLMACWSNAEEKANRLIDSARRNSLAQEDADGLLKATHQIISVIGDRPAASVLIRYRQAIKKACEQLPKHPDQKQIEAWLNATQAMRY